MWKFTFFLLAVLGIVTLGLSLDIFSRAPTRHQAYSPHRLGIYAAGQVEGATNEALLHAQSKGRVVELLVRENDEVEEGAILLRIDDDLQKHERSLAAANLAGARAQLERLINGARDGERQEARSLYEVRQTEMERAEKSWRRTEALMRDGVATAQSGEEDWALWQATIAQTAAAEARYELITAEPRPDEVQRLEAEVAAMEARLETADALLERTRLRAPMACRILQVNVELGELTGPESSAAPIVVADASQMRVRAYVEEMDALRVRVGMPATVTATGLSDREISGTVVRRSPRMATKRLFSDRPDELYDTKTREVWIELEDIDENDDLLIGLRVDVFIAVP